MRFNTLTEKLNDEDYFNNLCERRQRELIFCSKLLNEDEMNTYSSISVAYNVARHRFIEEYLPEINIGLYEKIKEGNKVPIFNLDKMIDDIKANT